MQTVWEQFVCMPTVCVDVLTALAASSSLPPSLVPFSPFFALFHRAFLPTLRAPLWMCVVLLHPLDLFA